ncbi:MAG: hypothetical protein D6812_08400 [Deltaproteobacteria bacterium]|nr:MAG: hypothetical protein D6812_08400 [Deltaproteobacteria bacterium]
MDPFNPIVRGCPSLRGRPPIRAHSSLFPKPFPWLAHYPNATRWHLGDGNVPLPLRRCNFPHR